MISTGITIPYIYWDKNTCSVRPTLPIEHGPAKTLQRNLYQQYLKAEKKPMVQSGTITIYRTMKKHLLAFQNHIRYKLTFDPFNAILYEHLVHYLTFEIPITRRAKIVKGLRMNTVGKTIKQLKIFIKDRIRKKIIPYIDLTCFKCLEEDVESVFSELETTFQNTSTRTVRKSMFSQIQGYIYRRLPDRISL